MSQRFLQCEPKTDAKIREWTEDGELWVQYVSSRKASRADVIQLQVTE
jgi:hypothetical protein